MKNGRVVDHYGTVFYYLNDKHHRLDGPAVEYDNGDKLYYVDDQLHRLDGPAVEYSLPNEYTTNKWYYKGKYINCKNQEEFEKYLKLKAFL
jgi:hypothetical protein